MRNKSIFISLLGVQLAPGSVQSSSVPSHSQSCKAFPGTDAWPSIAKWNQLNDTLSGRLIKPVAPAGVCHKGQPNYNEVACKALPDEWKSYDWHSRDPVSMMIDNWSNWTCLPDPKAPCSTAGYPAYVVNATKAEDVKAGVDFARENNIRIVVKSTGHDFLGRSNAPGSLSIWTHYLNAFKVHPGQFKLTGSDTVIKGGAITASGGSQMYDLYKATDKYNATIVGGGAKSVGAGGYFTGGGHGALSANYGLASDNVLEIEVVTPDGKIVVANEDQNADLFWALRGGGGSTFGVITSLTIRTHPTPKIQHTSLVAGIPANSTLRDEFLEYILGQVPHLLDSGLRGYCFLNTEGGPMPVDGIPPGLASFSGSMFLVNKDKKDLENILNSLNQTIQERFKDQAFIASEGIKSYNSWIDWYDVNYDQGTTGTTGLMVSRLIDDKAMTKDPKAFVNAIRTASKATGLVSFYPLAGKGVNDAVPRGGSSAVNPGWRKAYVHSLAALPFQPFNETSKQETAETLDKAFDPLRKLTPGLGAYINEASPYEKDPYTTFWGDNYERLQKIKRSVDPNDVFWCSPCVGNQRWKERTDGKLCKIDPMHFQE